MKYFFLLLCMTITRCTEAAVPACYPGDATAAESVPSVMIQSAGACVQWHCADSTGHKWIKQSICGTWSEATDEAIATLRTAMGAIKAEKDAQWSATFTQPLVTGSVDDQLMAAARTTTYPSAPPPGGLVTQDTKAYTLVAAVDKTTWQLVGTVPLGTACDASQRMGSYYRIDRTKVKYPAGTIMPKTTWASCGP